MNMQAQEPIPILYIQKALTPVEVVQWLEAEGSDMETVYLPGPHTIILPGEVTDTEREEVKFTQKELEEEILKCIEKAASKCAEDNEKSLRMTARLRGLGFHNINLKYVRVDYKYEDVQA